MGDVSLLEMRMEGQSLLDSGESSATKYSSRVGRARLANQNARKQARPTGAISAATTTTTALATAALVAVAFAASTLATAVTTTALPAATISSTALSPAASATPPSPAQHPSSLRGRVWPLALPSAATHPHNPHTHPASHPPTHRVQKMGVIAFGSHDFAVERHGQSAALVAPELGSCGSSGRLAALGSSALPGRGRPIGRPATASGARANPPPLTIQVERPESSRYSTGSQSSDTAETPAAAERAERAERAAPPAALSRRHSEVGDVSSKAGHGAV